MGLNMAVAFLLLTSVTGSNVCKGPRKPYPASPTDRQKDIMTPVQISSNRWRGRYANGTRRHFRFYTADATAFICVRRTRNGQGCTKTCLGAVLSNTWLITAAHCVDFDGVPPHSVTTYTQGRKYRAAGIYIHPTWRAHGTLGDRLAGDIAVMRVSGLQYKKRGTMGPRFRLAQQKYIPIPGPGRRLAVLGVYGGSSMRIETVRLERTARCGCSPQGSSFDEFGMLCTDTDKATGLLCDGDSGGPMFIPNKRGEQRLIGVSSAMLVPNSLRGSAHCGDRFTRDLYVDVSKYYGEFKQIFRYKYPKGWYGVDMFPRTDRPRRWVQRQVIRGSLNKEQEAESKRRRRRGENRYCGEPPEEPENLKHNRCKNARAY